MTLGLASEASTPPTIFPKQKEAFSQNKQNMLFSALCNCNRVGGKIDCVSRHSELHSISRQHYESKDNSPYYTTHVWISRILLKIHYHIAIQEHKTKVNVRDGKMSKCLISSLQCAYVLPALEAHCTTQKYQHTITMFMLWGEYK